MNKKSIILSILLAFPLLLAGGCAGVSGEKGPSKAEGIFFEVQTNWVEKVVQTTNSVQVTNTVVLTQTNAVGVIVMETNYVAGVVNTVSPTTNLQPVYTFVPKDTTKDSVEAIGSAVNVFAPGVGGLVSGALLAGFGLWGKLRSYKRSGEVLAGNIEALREFMKTLPDGSKYDAVLVSWLQKNQAQLGSIQDIAKLVETYVNNDDAKRSAAEIKALLDSLLKPSA